MITALRIQRYAMQRKNNAETTKRRNAKTQRNPKQRKNTTPRNTKKKKNRI